RSAASGESAPRGSCDPCTERVVMSPRLIVVPTCRSRAATATGRAAPSECARRWRAARSVATSAAVVIATTMAPSHRTTARGDRRDMASPVRGGGGAGAPGRGGVGGGVGGGELAGGGPAFRPAARARLGALPGGVLGARGLLRLLARRVLRLRFGARAVVAGA